MKNNKKKLPSTKLKLNYDLKTKLIPAIVQDYKTNEILMHAYMNKESLKLTLKTKRLTFFSRSRNKIWIKGETSGNYLNLVSIQTDCDQDTLLIKAEPEGPTCHLGSQSCFDTKTLFTKSNKKGKITLKENSLNIITKINKIELSDMIFLVDLEKLINERFENKSKKKSYINSLIKSGLDKIIQKVGEEATETVIAAKNSNKKDFIYESTDLLFHLLVLLRAKGSSLKDLVAELKNRSR